MVSVSFLRSDPDGLKGWEVCPCVLDANCSKTTSVKSHCLLCFLSCSFFFLFGSKLTSSSGSRSEYSSFILLLACAVDVFAQRLLDGLVTDFPFFVRSPPCAVQFGTVPLTAVIAEIFCKCKISYCSVREFSYALNFHAARAVSYTFYLRAWFSYATKFRTFSQKYEIHET